jgi:hypothetical protein
MLGVYLALSVIILIIVLVWHFYPRFSSFLFWCNKNHHHKIIKPDSICHLGLLHHYRILYHYSVEWILWHCRVSFVLGVPHHSYTLPSSFSLRVLPKWHMLGVYFRSLSDFLLIIVLVWHFLPYVFAPFDSTTNKHTQTRTTCLLPVTVDTSVHIYDDFSRLPFFHTHRKVSDLANELPEKLDHFRFLHATWLTNLKGSQLNVDTDTLSDRETCLTKHLVHSQTTETCQTIKRLWKGW